jgi:hypothetical protein
VGFSTVEADSAFAAASAPCEVKGDWASWSAAVGRVTDRKASQEQRMTANNRGPINGTFH